MIRKTFPLAVFIALLLGLLALEITPWYPVDDAYISYRYAQNWAEGRGPVFNSGERVEGYSNFLFVAVAALASRLGVTPPLAGRLINAASAVAILVLLLHALPGRLRHSGARYLAAVVFLLSLHTRANILSGLEAPFVAALVLAGALAFEARRRIATPLCFLALGLTRPEGIVLGALAGAADLARAVLEHERRDGRRVVLGWTLLLAVPYAAYTLWRVTYYGQILPSSVHAKMGFSPQESLRLALLYLKPAIAYYWPLLMLPVAGWLARWWGRRLSANGAPDGAPPTERSSAHELPEPPAGELWGVLLLTLGVIGITLRTGSGDPYLHFLRYPFPALPLLLVLAVLATERILKAARGSIGRATAAIFAIALLLTQIGLAVQSLRFSKSPSLLGERLAAGFELFTQQDSQPHHLEIPGLPLGLHAVAAWMVDNARPDELLATAEVGIVPYYSGARVIDTFGLITEHIARLPGRPGYKGNPDYVYGRDPEYFVFKKLPECLCSGIPADVALFRDPRLRRGYDLVRMFRDGHLLILLFKKRPPEDQPPIAYDFCANYVPELVVLRDKTGRPIERPDWAWTLISKISRDISEESSRRELLGRLQPAIRGEISDFEAADLMREWLAQYGCYTRQLPVLRLQHDLAITHRVAIPEHATLSFTVGLPADPRNLPREAANVFFEVEAEDSVGEVTVVFLQEVRPLEAPVWHEAEVDLGAFASQEVKISLRVYQEEGDPSRRTIYGTGWKDMVLLEKGEPGES